MLAWQYRSALARLKAAPMVQTQIKQKPDDALRGMSKKERKKMKKKNKKIEKNQKKKEEFKVMSNLVNFDPKKVKIRNVPAKVVRKSPWSAYLGDYHRGKSFEHKKVEDEDFIHRRCKSVKGRL